MKWGDLMLQAAGGGKKRGMEWTLRGDPSLRALSYYTYVTLPVLSYRLGFSECGKNTAQR